MTAPTQMPRRVRFGTFEADLESGELRRGGIKLKLQEQPFQILAMLLERPGEIVTREAVRERLWPADTFVDFDHSVNTAIKKLRQTLGDSAENPRFVETLARRGYRFIAPVAAPDPAASAAAVTHGVAAAGSAGIEASPALPPAPRHAPGGEALNRPLLFVLGCAGVACALGLSLFGVRQWARSDVPPAAASAPAAEGVQLAVLPLRVLTPGDAERYLGVGIADAIITHLANVRTLSVRPTAVVMKYEAGAADPRMAGRDLDAKHVLSGTLQKAQDAYRISMQLIRTADGVPIWGRNYDVRRTDLLTIEDEVSKQVADALRVQLIAREGARYRAPASPAAYEAYLQGRALLMNYSEAKMRAAVESFEAALRVDPDYARARAGLATAFAWFSVRYAYQNDALLWGRRAEEEATRALTLDRDLADAHLALADAAGTTYGHFNWPRVLAEAAEALRLDPALDPAHASRARALYHLGLFDAARREVAAAIALTGASNVETDRLLVAIALFDGRFADARQRAEELAGRSDAPVIRMYLATARFYLGERDQAAALLASIKRGAEPDLRSQAILAGVLAANGRRAAAQDMLDAVARNPAMDHHVAYSVGAAFAQLGRAAEAVRWLRTSANDGFACYPWYASDPLLDPIRNEAGFTELMEELRRRFESARGRYDTRPPV